MKLRKSVAACSAAAWLAAAAWSQVTRDFLTADEVDQIRLTAQDPIARLKLYATFARLRVDMLGQMTTTEKAGRSALIHQTLEDYTKIIEAIDTVADDALKKGKDIADGIGAVADAEKEALTLLKKIEESNPKDLARYRFALTTAIETTEDSLEISQQDLAERKAEVAAREAEDRKQRDALMRPQDVKERKQAAAKQAAEEAQQKKKTPTLRRKGEGVPKKP